MEVGLSDSLEEVGAGPRHRFYVPPTSVSGPEGLLCGVRPV